jgi:hypothetical protein
LIWPSAWFVRLLGSLVSTSGPRDTSSTTQRQRLQRRSCLQGGVNAVVGRQERQSGTSSSAL